MNIPKLNINYFRSNTLTAGVDIIYHDSGYSINCILLEKIKDKINIVKTLQDIASFSELANNIPQKTPIQISINGKGVICRNINESKDINLETRINNIIPGADINQIYYSILNNTSTTIINIIRKDLINKTLKEIDNFNLFVTKIIIGISSFNAISSLINDKPVLTKNYKILQAPYLKCDYIKSDEYSEHYIADDIIKGCHIIPYANVLSWILDDDISTNLNEINKFRKSEYIAYKRFKFTLISGLSASLLILVLNILFFSYLTKSNDTLNAYLNNHKTDLQILSNLKHEVDLKDKYLFENNLLSGTKFSYYGDRIGYLVPKDIRLTSLNIFPMVDVKKPSSKIKSFHNDQIIINGTGSHKSLQIFIKSLLNEHWIIDVDIDKYNQEKNSQKGEFSITVYISE